VDGDHRRKEKGIGSRARWQCGWAVQKWEGLWRTCGTSVLRCRFRGFPGDRVEIFCSTWNSFDERQEDLEIRPAMFHVEHWREFEM
jgi:hypothetical protein